MLILVMALTKAWSQAALFSAKTLNGIIVNGFCAMFLSAGSVNGALPLLVSE